MKTEIEIRERIDTLISQAVETSYQEEEEKFLAQAKELAWVLGMHPTQIKTWYEKALDERYGEE